MVDPSGNGKGFETWEKMGSVVKLFLKNSLDRAYYKFSLSGSTLTFIKLAGPNSEGEWQEDYAGEDFFEGKFYQISLQKQ